MAQSEHLGSLKTLNFSAFEFTALLLHTNKGEGEECVSNFDTNALIVAVFVPSESAESKVSEAQGSLSHLFECHEGCYWRRNLNLCF